MRRFAMLVAVMAALPVVGCGGDSDEPAATTGAEALTAEEFVAAADAQCEESNADIPPAPQTAEEAVEASRAEIAFRTRLAAEFRELTPPEELESEVEEYIDLNEQVIDIRRKQLEAANQDDRQEFVRLDRELLSIFQERERLATEIGFEVCGMPIDEPSQQE